MSTPFAETLARWQHAAREVVTQRLLYEQTYAQALIKADGKTAEVRKAQADLAALDALRAYELAEVEALALEHQVLFLRGDNPLHKEASQPGAVRGASRRNMLEHKP